MKASAMGLLSAVAFSWPCLGGELVFNAPKDSMAIDVGRLEEGSQSITVTYSWTNRLGRPVEIDQIIKSCHCTAVLQSINKIRAGESVHFSSTLDLTATKGHARFNFVVQFKDRTIEPLRFDLQLFRPIAPSAEPSKVDFGILDRPEGSTRRFRVVAISDSKELGLVSELPSATDDRVAVRLVDKQSTLVPFLDTPLVTRHDDLTFEAKVKSADEPATVEGKILIPVTYRGERRTVSVPFRGDVPGRIIPRPSRLVAFVGASSQGRAHLNVKLYCRDRGAAITSVKCDCPDPRIAATFSGASEAQSRGPSGVIQVDVDTRDQRGIESAIAVEALVDGQSVRLSIPVKVGVVQLSEKP